MKHKDIYGRWTGSAIGFCSYEHHRGVITPFIIKDKHCAHCKYFTAFPNFKEKQRYKNRKRKNRRR